MKNLICNSSNIKIVIFVLLISLLTIIENRISGNHMSKLTIVVYCVSFNIALAILIMQCFSIDLFSKNKAVGNKKNLQAKICKILFCGNKYVFAMQTIDEKELIEFQSLEEIAKHIKHLKDFTNIDSIIVDFNSSDSLNWITNNDVQRHVSLSEIEKINFWELLKDELK